MKQFSVRIPEELHAELVEEARSEDRTLNAHVTRILKERQRDAMPRLQKV